MKRLEPVPDGAHDRPRKPTDKGRSRSLPSWWAERNLTQEEDGAFRMKIQIAILVLSSVACLAPSSTNSVLRADLSSPDFETRRKAAMELHEQGDNSGVPAMIEAMQVLTNQTFRHDVGKWKSRAETATNRAFDFGTAAPAPGAVRVTSRAAYTADAGFGWLRDRPAVFAVSLPEGNYDVTVGFRDAAAAAATTVKAESRRLMLMRQEGTTSTVRRFTVNVRRPAIEGGGRVHLNARELTPPADQWDDRLTLEFLPDPGVVAALEVRSAPQAVTVYLAGDSTVTDQRDEPWAAWGQMLPRFLAPDVAVANHAESGRALHSFRREGRLDKILGTIRAGDYLFVQFGHNDQKDKTPGSGPFTTYKENLKQYVRAARDKDAFPVLVTPMERRRWSGGKPGQTLADFAEAVRQVGREERVSVIDLHAMSLELYGALGEEGSKRAFVHYAARTFPGQDEPLKDDSHHSPYGAYELARCVVEGIRKELPDLARNLREDAGRFDPSKPDDPREVDIPPSPTGAVEKPEGN